MHQGPWLSSWGHWVMNSVDSSGPDGERPTVRLGNIADIVMGQSPDSACVNDDEEGLPFLQGCAEFGRREPKPELYCSPPARVAPQDSVLVSVRAPVGTLNWADQRYCIGRGLGSIKGRDGASDTRFLGYALTEGAHYLHRRSQGSTFLAIGSEDLRSFPVPGFAFGAQQKISQMLGAADAAIEKTEALIEKYQQIKAGLMHDLFTRGIGADGKLRPPREQAPELYKETPIGWIPADWTVTTLASVGQVDRGKFTARPRNDPQYYDGDVPFIQTGDVAANLGEKIFEYSQTLNKRGLAVSKVFPEGTVMITIAANIADTCILGVPMCAPDSLVGLIPKNPMDTDFIELSIQRRKRWLFSRAPQSAQKNINLEDLRPLQIGWPKEQERSQIAQQIRLLGRYVKCLEADLYKLGLQKKGLLADLLSGDVEVANV